MKNRIIAAALVVAALTTPVFGQSLWAEAKGRRAIFADTSAGEIGDILTIVIDENQRVDNEEDTNLGKESSLSTVIENFDIAKSLFDLPYTIGGNNSRDFTGRATYEKDNSFSTKISVVVIDVHPNGNLLVEGSRTLVMDGETKVVKITGLVRPMDISATNTIRSEYVANAAISYRGTGTLTNATNKGWFSRFIDVVWPF